MKKLRISAFFILFMFTAMPAFANLIKVTVNQNGVQSTETFRSVLDAFDRFEKGDLNQILAQYDKNLPGTADIDFRGVPIAIAYTQESGGWQIKVDIPSLGRIETFVGATQDQAFDFFKKFLEKNQDGLLKDLLEASIKTTPFDTVAGNPNSLIFRMLDAGYNTVEKDYIFRPYYSYSHLKSKDGKTASASTLHIPLGYNFNLNEKSRLILDVPLTITSIESSLAYDMQLGLTYKHQVYKQNNAEVALAVGGRLGVGGSIDLLSGGLLWALNASAISKFQINDSFSINVVNTIGFYDDITIKVQDYSIGYSLGVIGFKNGIEFDYSFNPNLSGQVALIDTRFFGNKQYINSYEELRLGLSYNTVDKRYIDQFNVFTAYRIGEHHYQGFRLGFELKF